jgi:hypothetical protein
MVADLLQLIKHNLQIVLLGGLEINEVLMIELFCTYWARRHCEVTRPPTSRPAAAMFSSFPSEAAAI